MIRSGLLYVAAAAAITVSGCSKTERAAEQPAGAPAAVGTGGAGANLSDAEFVRDVTLKNMAEVELSRMAVDKATNPEIKSFAKRMIDDHGAAGHQLKSALSGHVDWPVQLDGKDKEIADELATMQGASFDHRYVKAMVEGHQDLAAKLESRLDVQSLADWKTAAAGRTETKALPEPQAVLRDVNVRPNKSGNDVSMKINQWAADTYPVAQKHLDTARTLQTAMNKGSSPP